jgi:Ni2+-binding GTPase involved in maturation of urease and hydrogenase
VKKVRLILVGGFLGSGKTTLLFRAARKLVSRGTRVGLVTNDQAPGNVDTRLLAQQGLDVREVGGKCFCCDFPALLRNAGKLRKEIKADVILLEPVGSCTDLSATVLQPLKEHFRQEFIPSPLSVLVDPYRLRQVLSGKRRTDGRGPNYIFRKQLEEADRILIAKADLIDRDERKELRRLVSGAFPGVPVRTISAVTGAGVSGWLDEALTSTTAGNRIASVDYDVYAEGEATLGWLNADLSLDTRGCCVPDWRMLCLFVMREMKQAFTKRRAAVGHVKTILIANGRYCAGNLTRLGGPIDLRGDLDGDATRVRMTINARVEMAPKELKEIVLKALESVIGRRLRVTVHNLRAFRPARPRPLYRYAEPV